MPKTGSTSIQNFLFENREKLLEKGYLYPISGTNPNRPGRYNHYGLATVLMKNYDPKGHQINKLGIWENMKIEITMIKPKNVIISSEFFSGQKDFYNSDMIDLIKKILQEYETKIIIYIRRQDEFFRSFYCQRVKNFITNTDNISEFILEWKYQANYYSTIELWKNSFGIKNIIVRPFEKEQMENGSLIDDFLAAIHLVHNENEFKPIMQNISPNGKAIKLIILFDKIIRIRQLLQLTNKHWWEVAFFREYMSFRIKLAKLISWFIPDFLISEKILSEEDKASIMEEFEESNRKVAQEYLGREDGILFYSKP